MKNIFRTKTRALTDKKGFHNPCSHCWRWTCKKCLALLLADFGAVLRSDPKLSSDFEKLYNKVHGHSPTTRPERRKIDRNKKAKMKQLAKLKKPDLKAVN